jgi:hypothetical protein
VKPFDAGVLAARIRTNIQLVRLHCVELENASHRDLLHDIMPAHIVER